MADVLTERITNCLDDCEELTKRVEAIETVQDDLSDRVYKQEYWRDGNGSRGAETRLQCVEQALADLPIIKSDLEVVKIIADAKLHNIAETVNGAVGTALSDRDKTTIAKVKAWSPIAVSALALVTIIVQIILGRVL
jgi:hypothetical protein